MFNASMQFDLGEDVNALRDMVHRWAQDRVKPMAQQIDQQNEFPAELWQEMGELGLLGVPFPKSSVGPRCHIWRIPSRLKRSPGLVPQFRCLMAPIRTFASIKSS